MQIRQHAIVLIFQDIRFEQVEVLCIDDFVFNLSKLILLGRLHKYKVVHRIGYVTEVYYCPCSKWLWVKVYFMNSWLIVAACRELHGGGRL